MEMNVVPGKNSEIMFSKMSTFKSLGLARPILRGVESAGYKTPTPIQSSAIPLACEHHDLIGCAQTGTGKTAAFVLPLLDRMVKKKHKKHSFIRSLILVPTRELALQITEAIHVYGRFTRLSVLPVFGGVDIFKQTRTLRRGVDIVVATPGRLLDHLNRGNIDLTRVELLILDEADRMLDMGFIHDIRKIIAETPRQRQTLLFSATMSSEIEKMAQSVLRKPEVVQVGKRRNPADTVVQSVCTVKQTDKMNLLVHVLKNEPIESVIVFTRTKYRADKINRQLKRKGFSAIAMHSDRSQSQRQRALEGLKNGKFKILVATNIASRGIDLDKVSHVINYDTPEQVENYIHRIGRTGRGEADGHAVTFVSEDEHQRLRDIEKHIGKRIARVDYEGLTSRSGSHKQQSSSPAVHKAKRSRKSSSRRAKTKNKNKPKFKTAKRAHLDALG